MVCDIAADSMKAHLSRVVEPDYLPVTHTNTHFNFNFKGVTLIRLFQQPLLPIRRSLVKLTNVSISSDLHLRQGKDCQCYGHLPVKYLLSISMGNQKGLYEDGIVCNKATHRGLFTLRYHGT